MDNASTQVDNAKKINGPIIKKPTLPKAKYPAKTTMNLMQKKLKSQILPDVIVYSILVILILLAVALYGVYIPTQEYNAKKSELETKQTTLRDLISQISSYSDTQEKYFKYSYNYMTFDEYAQVDRSEVIKMVEEVIMPCGEISNMTISGSIVSIIMNVENYSDLSDAVIKLYSYDIVNGVSVNYANDTSKTSQSSLVIYLVDNMEYVREMRKFNEETASDNSEEDDVEADISDDTVADETSETEAGE